MNLFVSRHAGAKAWAEAQGVQIDAVEAHLDTERVEPGDQVIGTLPIHLVAEVCARGGRYLHLEMQVPPDLRGQELSAAQMTACGAQLSEFAVQRVTT